MVSGKFRALFGPRLVIGVTVVAIFAVGLILWLTGKSGTKSAELGSALLSTLVVGVVLAAVGPQFNQTRNVITDKDVRNDDTSVTAGSSPEVVDVPPAKDVSLLSEATAPTESGMPAQPLHVAIHTPEGPPIPQGDGFFGKVAKLLIPELVLAYLFLAAVIESNVTDRHAEAVWLGGLLIFWLVLSVVYNVATLRVIRMSQLAMSVLGLAVFVFCIGGWFATTTWWRPWYGSIAIPLYLLVVAVVRFGPLPQTVERR